MSESMHTKLVPHEVDKVRTTRTIFMVEQAIIRDSPENWDYVKLFGKGTQTALYMSRESLIGIRDAINDYLVDEGEMVIEILSPESAPSVSTEPELELHFQ